MESSSKKKIGPHLQDYDQFKGGSSFESDPNDIICLGKLEMLLSNIAVSSKCGGSLPIFTTNRQGLSLCMHVKCNSCRYEVSDYNSSKLKEGKGKSEVNVRLAYVLRGIGKGEQSATMFSGVMNLPKPPPIPLLNTTPKS